MIKDRNFFAAGARQVQERFGTTALADRIVERLGLEAFDAHCRDMITSSTMFFLATADLQGQPDCSYKGGAPGFVTVTGDRTLEFPHYDGNGMFRSLGNIVANPHVGLLFIDFESPRRLRINGIARVRYVRAAGSPAGTDAIVTVEATAIFPNCPRYVHQMTPKTISEYAPRAGHVPPAPEWKRRPEFAAVLPEACKRD